MCCVKGRNTPVFEPTCLLLLFENHIWAFWGAALLTTSLKSAVVLNCHSEQLCSFPMLKTHNCQSQMKITHQHIVSRLHTLYRSSQLLTFPFYLFFFSFSYFFQLWCWGFVTFFTRFIKYNKSPSAFNSSGNCWNKWLNLRRLTIKLHIKWVEMLSLFIFSHSPCVRTAVLFVTRGSAVQGVCLVTDEEKQIQPVSGNSDLRWVWLFIGHPIWQVSAACSVVSKSLYVFGAKSVKMC